MVPGAKCPTIFFFFLNPYPLANISLFLVSMGQFLIFCFVLFFKYSTCKVNHSLFVFSDLLFFRIIPSRSTMLLQMAKRSIFQNVEMFEEGRVFAFQKSASMGREHVILKY